MGVCATSFARADWPHARGPAYDGVSTETGLADAWPENGPPQLWSRELGKGFSGIIAVQGRLFTQHQTTAGQSLVCLDAANGDILWQTRYARPWQHQGAYPGPYATPTWTDGRVYFTSPTGLTGCANAETGELVWSVELDERFKPRGCDFGVAATPLVIDGRVILPVGDVNAGLVALDARDGRTLWTAGGDPASYCPAFPIVVAGRRCVVGYMQNALIIVDAADGTLLHRHSLSTGYDEHSAWPIYREPRLLLTAPFRAHAAAWNVRDDSIGKLLVQPDWTSKHLSNDVVSSVLVGEHVYGFDLRQLQSSLHRPSRGSFQCLDWATGASRWSSSLTGHAAAAAADGKLLLLNDTGELILIRATPETYDELARVKLFEDEPCWTPPTIWRGRAFVRGPTKIVCLDISAHAAAPPSPAIARLSRSWRFDPMWLMTREREFPNDAPTFTEMSRWYLASIAMIVVAGVVSLGRRPFADAVAFALALVGPNVVASFVDECVFTWPLGVYLVLELAARGTRESPSRSRLALAGLVLICVVYFFACRWVGLPLAWNFLFGLVPAAPFALLSAKLQRESRKLVATMASIAGFTIFFWTPMVVLVWQS